MSDNIEETIVNLLNQASIYGKDSTRVQHLRHVQELILRKDPTLLSHFLEDVLNFQTDKSIEVKKTIISFIEEACQYDPKLIIKLIDRLNLLLFDDNIFVKKKFILSMISIYKSTLTWLSKSQLVDESINTMWKTMNNIKNHIISMLNMDDDRICTVVVKFIEMLAVTLYRYEQECSITDDKIILCRIELEKEGKEMIEKLLDLVISNKLSSVNLIAAIDALINIVRQRSDYLSRVIQTFEILTVNLSSSFTDSEANNLRKTIKLKLLNLLKYSCSSNIQSEITNLLGDLGATQAEILKCLPKSVQEQKRKTMSDNNSECAKKRKNLNEHAISHSNNDGTDTQFQSNHTTTQNIKSSVMVSSKSNYKIVSTSTNISQSITTDSTKISKKVTSFKLSNVVKRLDNDEVQRMSVESFHRVLHAEDVCETTGINRIREKLTASLVCLFEQSFHDIYEDYIFTDVCQRYDLAFTWLFQEYVNANGYVKIIEPNQKKDFTKYDNILYRLLKYLKEKDYDLFSRLIKTVPLITDNALSILKECCQNESSFYFGINTLHNLIVHRTTVRDKCLAILLNLSHHENISVRNEAIHSIRYLYEKKGFKNLIEEYALKCLSYLRMPKPPDISFCHDESPLMTVWTDDLIQRYLSLYFCLITLNHCLIHSLSTIYIEVDRDIKKSILQILGIPIREMGMASSELVNLIKNCPKGAETLVIRVVQVLTQCMPPSHEIIESIRDLYDTRISDIRLLIPILAGLKKHEILSALPKFIKLSPTIVKEVFNRILGWNDSSNTSQNSVMSPSELLVALHQISLEECDLKIIINATSICFNSHSIYTPDVLANVLQQLVEMTPIPILFMRTVIQTYSLYPKMVHFIMTILQRLIGKQAWKQARIWEGFIQCCNRTQPHSFSILLQLPPVQLQQILQKTAELRNSLLHYIRSLSDAQRSLLSRSILIVIENDLENMAPLSVSTPSE